MPFNLGMNLNLPQPSFSLPTLPVLPNNGSLPQASSENILNVSIKPPGVGLLTGTTKGLLKEIDLSPSPEVNALLKMGGVVVSAAQAGKRLATNIDKALDAGQPRAEAYICESARTLTEEVTGKLLKGAIVGGIPPYLAASIGSPPLAATIPVILPLIPQAYSGAQIAGQISGNAANTACHAGFDYARQLSGGK